MSFLKRLFGGGGGDKPSAPAATLEHKGFLITASPAAEGGQHRVSGTISKEIGGVRREVRLERADRLASRDEAVEMTLKKGRQAVDEQGDGLFS